MTRLSARLLALTLAAGLLALPAAAQSAPARPKATAPGVNSTVTALPVLTWNKAKRAQSYEVQIASDSGFNPAMIDETTQNLRYLHPKMLPNGAYFWRLRALDAQGGSSKWTPVRKFNKKWTNLATLSTPANLGAISYPNPAILRWSQVPGASTYLISIATGASGGGVDAPGGIISNGALAISDGGKPISTSNTNFAISSALHAGTYYWQIRPVDAEGNMGTPSAISSFVWTWNAKTAPAVTDMVSGPEIFDPLFSWTPIPGAAKYEIEVNYASGFAPGSQELFATTNATAFAPLRTLPNNTYYWRVRGVDPQGQAGPWNNGPLFAKDYDQPPAPPGPPNLTVKDTQYTTIAPGGNVDEPVLIWDTVPGASHYQVTLDCGSSHGVYDTANTAWTPFRDPNTIPPGRLFSAHVAGGDFAPSGTCSVSVRAVAKNATGKATGDIAIFGQPATTSFVVGSQSPAFSNLPVDCTIASPSCAGRLTGSDVLRPLSGNTVGKSPLICWRPADMDSNSGTTPSQGYWVAIARDAPFTTIVQAAYTAEPCYAPRTALVDEATSYYWQVIPVATLGNSASYSPLGGSQGGFPLVSPPSFQHASLPPAPISPVGGAAVAGPVVFRWGVAPEQVKDYTIEVAQDDSFSTILDTQTTDATSYSAATTYPVGATVFWRVRVNNDDNKGLAWSATSSFVQTLPAPQITTPEAFSGETFPALMWNPVDGATSYEVQDVWSDASVHSTSNIQSTAVSYTKMTGTGHGTVQVRAVFPGSCGGGSCVSAYSPARSVVHTIGEPQGAHTLFNKKTGALTLAWKAKPNAKSYKVQISRNPGFVQPAVDDTTDQSAYTPLKTQQEFSDGGLLYWRVAAIDPDGNTGGFTRAVKLTLLARMTLTVSSTPARRQRGPLVVTVTKANGKPLKGAAVRIAGAGISSITRRTNAKGVATFLVKPTKKGSIGVRGTKSKYRVGLTTVPIT